MMGGEAQSRLVEMVQKDSLFWEERGFVCTIYRDTADVNRFLLTFSSNLSVDVFTEVIQNEPRAREFFKKLQESESRVLISYFEQLGDESRQDESVLAGD
jgi:hypothetical protein